MQVTSTSFWSWFLKKKSSNERHLFYIYWKFSDCSTNTTCLCDLTLILCSRKIFIRNTSILSDEIKTTFCETNSTRNHIHKSRNKAILLQYSTNWCIIRGTMITSINIKHQILQFLCTKSSGEWVSLLDCKGLNIVVQQLIQSPALFFDFDVRPVVIVQFTSRMSSGEEAQLALPKKTKKRNPWGR